MATILSGIDCGGEWSLLNADGECVHKDLLPLIPADGLATLVMVVASVLGGAAGIGGGGLNVPLLMLTLKFTHLSIPKFW